MSELTVRGPSGTYPVHVAHGLLAQTGKLMRQVDPRCDRAVIVTNPTVGNLYEVPVCAALEQEGIAVTAIRVPDGESHKTLATVAGLYDALVEHGADRTTAVVALGGGVIGDTAGFAAATYLRGVPLVQVPTTLLAMVDASVGGKVAVDHPRGKNLVGAFYPPRLVVADTACLATLPPEEFRAGMAEVIKHGIIDAPDLFEHLEAQGAEPIEWIVERAIRVKIDIVEEDPFETGRRAVLNLGHTFAHAFEAVSGYALRHGAAVGIGLIAAAQTAVAVGLCAPEVEARIAALVRRFDLPTTFGNASPEVVRAAMATDKKRRGARLRFVLPRAIGDVVVRDDVPEDVILSILKPLCR